MGQNHLDTCSAVRACSSIRRGAQRDAGAYSRRRGSGQNTFCASLLLVEKPRQSQLPDALVGSKFVQMRATTGTHHVFRPSILPVEWRRLPAMVCVESLGGIWDPPSVGLRVRGSAVAAILPVLSAGAYEPALQTDLSCNIHDHDRSIHLTLSFNNNIVRRMTYIGLFIGLGVSILSESLVF